MSSVLEEKKAGYLELIECFKNYRCLWDLKSPNEAYLCLLDIYRKIQPDATLDGLKKKLDNMRSSYKRELRKVKTSETTGTSTDNIYVPRLWYFDHISFLDEKECIRGGTNFGRR